MAHAISAPAPQAHAAVARPRSAFWLAANAAALLTAAIAMRVWRLGNVPGVNGDESWSGAWAIALLHGANAEDFLKQNGADYSLTW